VNIPSPVAPSVVVGVDGSVGSVLAVRWAAADAARRHRSLRLVHAFNLPKRAYPPVGVALPVVCDAETRATAALLLTDAAAQARKVDPGLPITTTTSVQASVPALLAASKHADEVVVGNRGLGGFPTLLSGSTAQQLTAHAVCPVVIVRLVGAAGGTNAGRVVVGIDGSHNADHALGFAFEQAAFRRAGLAAVHACQSHDDLCDDERRLLTGTLAGWHEKYPDVEVRLYTVLGRAGAALASASTGAALLVVGARGHGGFAGLLLGSVSQAAVEHSRCPVAVIRRFT
jgi:nucleotide-binding universal stress UspA family protein